MLVLSQHKSLLGLRTECGLVGSPPAPPGGKCFWGWRAGRGRTGQGGRIRPGRGQRQSYPLPLNPEPLSDGQPNMGLSDSEPNSNMGSGPMRPIAARDWAVQDWAAQNESICLQQGGRKTIMWRVERIICQMGSGISLEGQDNSLQETVKLGRELSDLLLFCNK